ncbi:S8 family serine peptidase [Archangium violaceum]|uniref:S8 family peptidase n=1 Tax=Archangium violaceum TaxID=83451 RepID=UPI00194E5F0A|nr:S8 family peptidase [Archangium violaceum]QRN94395.1 S8 family serine peptidase [Archangium violaceum]
MKSPRYSSPLTGALVGLALWTTAPAADAAPQQQLQPRAAAEKRTQKELPAGTPVERLVVKFHEGSRVRLRDRALRSMASERSLAERALLSGRGLSEARVADDVKAVQALLERAPRTAAPRRLFSEDESTLEARKASGEARSGHQLADLNLYVEVPLLPGTTAERVRELVDALNALDSVEVAYAQPPAEPAMVNFGLDEAVRGVLAAADISPTTPLYESQQGYLNAAPAGIDARFAWTMAGGKGAGVRIVDIEGGWRTTHEDLPPLFHTGGTQINDVSWRNHGTAVLGEMVAAANGYGVTGISHEAVAGIESHSGVGVATAVNRAAAAVGRGGIVLIEAHSPGPADATPCTCNTSQCNYIAMEYWQGEYDAIATATANGVVVVEAAGNGSANLDDAAYGGRFNRAVRDSGAIIVGASQGSSRAPTCWTNFGGRVDVHGWGQSVTTLGYGDLFGSAYGEDQYYTSGFSGTSSASPIVTGAAASIQGVAMASGRGALDSRTVRTLLTSTGTPQSSDSRNIGPLPDLRRALVSVAPPDQYLVGDWNGDGRSNLATRRASSVLMDFNFDGTVDLNQGYGDGAGEDQYLAGDWNGDGRSNVAVRRGHCVHMDTNFDGTPELTQCYGNGAGEDQYLVGDWDGDGRSNLAVRRGSCVHMDTNFDGTSELTQCYGNGAGEDQYLVGDWDGDGRSNLAVRRGSCVYMDTNFDGTLDITQCYGNGGGENEYLVGDWNGDRRSNLAVRRGGCVHMDYNFDGTSELTQCFNP